MEEIDKKITALTLLLITAFAAVVGGLLVTTNTANAAEANSTTSSTSTTTSDVAVPVNEFPFVGMGGMMMGDQGFGGGPGGHGRGMGGMGRIEISTEYNATVNAVLAADSDVQDLISQGYNVTSIHPIITSIVEADGTIATKASTAMVTLVNGTSGFATVSVDVTNAKVTQIIIFTRTVIDKTST